MTAEFEGSAAGREYSSRLKAAVFLDRDGVINAMVYNAEFGLVDSPSNPSQFRLLPGAPEAIRRIRELGYLAVVISNQPGVAKGKFSPQLLDEMTAGMVATLAEQGAILDAIYYCKHHPDGVLSEYRMVCDCRKPKPGMIFAAVEDLGIDLSRSFFIGDGITDMQAGRAAGVTTILVYPSSCIYLCDELNRQNVQPDYIVRSITEAVERISEIDMRRRELSTEGI